jgi:hypothetical protein
VPFVSASLRFPEEEDTHPEKAPGRRLAGSGSVGIILKDFNGNRWDSPVPGTLFVRARANLFDSVVDQSFVWFVQIQTINGHRVVAQIYEHQPFSVVKGESVHPIFEDAFDVEPGEYHIFVGLRDRNQNGTRRQSCGAGFFETVPDVPAQE